MSGDLCRSVVWHGYPGVDPDRYERLVRVKVTGRFHEGWVHTPHEARPASGR